MPEDIRLPLTRQGFERIAVELKRLKEVDRPAIIKAIGEARALGDLSENAEYKAALEHQEQLKARVSALDEELKKARIVDSHDVNTDETGFGCRVTLMNLDSKSEEVLTILGEWESNPQAGIISYKSPLGRSILFRKPGDEFEFQLDSKKTRYKVVNISLASVFGG